MLNRVRVKFIHIYNAVGAPAVNSLFGWMKPWRLALLLVFGFAVMSHLMESQGPDFDEAIFSYPKSEHHALPIFKKTIEVGTQELPEFRSLLLVDPGMDAKYTEGFQKAFETFSSNLQYGQLSAYQMKSQVLSLAQRVPDINISDQSRMNDFVSQMRSPASLSPAEMDALRMPQESGKTFGDSLGFSARRDRNRILFEPASVVGLDKSQVSPTIGKNIQESHDIYFSEIQKRLSVIWDHRLGNYSFNRDLLESRSGMCALARALKQPSFFDGQQIPSIYLFSDVDDFDPNGQSCIASYKYSDGKTPLFNGECQTQKTIFEFEKNEEKEHQCVYQYNDSYNYKIIRENPKWNSVVSFYQISHYNCDETEMKFLEVKEWRKKMTRLEIVYEKLDADNQWTSSSVQKWIQGALTPKDCESAISREAPEGSRVIKQKCVPQELPVPSKDPLIESCSYSDIHCSVARTEEKRYQFPGDYQTTCASQAQSRSSSIVPGTIDCQLTGQIRTSIASLPLCRPVIATSKDTKNEINEDLRTQEACNERVLSMGGYIDEKYPAICKTKLGVERTRISGQIKLNNFKISSYEIFRDNETDCPADIKQQIAAKEGVLPDEIVRCRISYGDQKAFKEKLAEDSCHRQSYKFCRAHPDYISCSLKAELFAGPGTRKMAFKADEALNCKSKCKDSVTKFCGGTDNDAMTIEDFFKAKYGMSSKCQSQTQAANTVTTFFARESKELPASCEKKINGIPVYPKITQEFTYDGYIPEYVAGNKVKDGRLVPNQNLIDFISDRLKSIYGEHSIDIQFFIHRMGDRLYSGGRYGRFYQELAAKIGAQIHSLDSFDFPGVFAEQMQKNLHLANRQFIVSEMKTSQRIIHISVRRKITNQVEELNDSDWVQTGLSVHIKEAVPLDIGDEIEILYQ